MSRRGSRRRCSPHERDPRRRRRSFVGEPARPDRPRRRRPWSRRGICCGRVRGGRARRDPARAGGRALSGSPGGVGAHATGSSSTCRIFSRRALREIVAYTGDGARPLGGGHSCGWTRGFASFVAKTRPRRRSYWGRASSRQRIRVGVGGGMPRMASRAGASAGLESWIDVDFFEAAGGEPRWRRVDGLLRAPRVARTRRRAEGARRPPPTDERFWTSCDHGGAVLRLATLMLYVVRGAWNRRSRLLLCRPLACVESVIAADDLKNSAARAMAALIGNLAYLRRRSGGARGPRSPAQWISRARTHRSRTPR